MNNVFEINAARSMPESYRDELAEMKKQVRQLHRFVKTLLEAGEYVVSPSKEDAKRDVILRHIRGALSEYDEVVFPPAKSEDVFEVIRLWESECGPKNQWVRALKAFAERGGNIKWYSGYPHTAEFKHFVLYDENWKELTYISSLAGIKRGINILCARAEPKVIEGRNLRVVNWRPRPRK
jgi:hypothetical protein